MVATTTIHVAFGVGHRSRQAPSRPQWKDSGLTIIRGVCLILLALLFGFVAAVFLRAGAMDSNEVGRSLVEAIWRTYFGTMLTLCAIALILGFLLCQDLPCARCTA